MGLSMVHSPAETLWSSEKKQIVDTGNRWINLTEAGSREGEETEAKTLCAFFGGGGVLTHGDDLTIVIAVCGNRP